MKEILERLDVLYPNPTCELVFNSPFELLVSVILSAQCTDKRVNAVTKELYKTHNKPIDFANMPILELEESIKSCGFYHNKAKNIKEASIKILEDYNGEIPSSQEQLMELPGVGRKTANVVYSLAFGGDAIAVDTHVFRVSNRLGIVKAKNPDECEEQLMKKFPKQSWSRLHYQLVLFGRYRCKAIHPECQACIFNDMCKYYHEVVRKEK